MVSPVATTPPGRASATSLSRVQFVQWRAFYGMHICEGEDADIRLNRLAFVLGNLLHLSAAGEIRSPGEEGSPGLYSEVYETLEEGLAVLSTFQCMQPAVVVERGNTSAEFLTELLSKSVQLNFHSAVARALLGLGGDQGLETGVHYCHISHAVGTN